MRRFPRRRLCAIAAAALVAGCALQSPIDERHDAAELSGVPFFPQTEYDCGPAALATVLGAAGRDVTPEDLVPQVYTEGLRGSLQVELLAAARREGRIPIPVGQSFEALFGLVRAGFPVLVLQNLRLPRWPAWHYAVVVGYDAPSDRVILRSGDERRQLTRARRFAASWALADHWGFVVVSPGAVPDGIGPGAYIRAVVESERLLPAAATRVAYEAGVEKWPDEPAVLFPYAGHLLATARLDEAGTVYRRLLGKEPDNVAARNNLAHVLMEQGCIEAASREARRALERSRAGEPFHEAILDTVAAIDAAAARGGVSRSTTGACG